MKKSLCVLMVLAACSFATAAEPSSCVNAFGETATAYLNDAFLLLGTTADGFVGGITQKETAVEIAKNVQKRVRLVRGKLKTVSSAKLVESDSQLFKLLDDAFGRLDHLAWALVEYIENKNPDTAKRFDGERIESLNRIRKIADFYMTLPASPEAAEPLSTR
jgi:hypothetical protein